MVHQDLSFRHSCVSSIKPTHSIKPCCAGCPSTLGLVLDVGKYSSAWHEAFGTAFFYPESSIDRSYGVINDFEPEWELHNHRCKKIDDIIIKLSIGLSITYDHIQMAKSCQYYELAYRKKIFVGISFCYFADKKFAKYLFHLLLDI
mgnify:CR=1 FL=1